MSDPHTTVIGGVDCHQQTHHVVALDDHGHRLGDQAFAANSRGYAQVLSWLQQFGCIQAVGVESTASYGAGLTRHLLAAGIKVIEVNQPHRQLRARRGKSDAIDAEGAARKVLSGEATAQPKDTTGSVEAIRQLRLVRASAIKARTAALEQLGDLTTTAPAGSNITARLWNVTTASEIDRVNVVAGSRSGTSGESVALDAATQLSVDILAVGSTTAGQDITVQVAYLPVLE